MKTPDHVVFIGEWYETLKQIISILYKCLQYQKEEILSNSFGETKSSLNPKIRQEERKENKANPVHYIDAKI